MTTAAIKITRKGQVTIPKEIRDRLKTNSVYFEVANDIVIVKPVRNAAGISKYCPSVIVKKNKNSSPRILISLT